MSTSTTPEPAQGPAFLRRVHQLSGIGDDAGAERAARAVLSVFAEELPAEDRAWLAQTLAPELRPLTGTASSAVARADDDLDAFYQRVAAREGLEFGFAVEHAQCVCRALAESLDDGERRHLQSRLPSALRELLEPPEPTQAPGPHVHPPAPRHNLAAGSPVSRHPLSEAEPRDAQQDSVARSDNPHADSKLSSSRGTTQEREAETLARGKPSPRRG